MKQTKVKVLPQFPWRKADAWLTSLLGLKAWGSDALGSQPPANDLHVLGVLGHLILVPAQAAAEVSPQLLGRQLGEMVQCLRQDVRSEHSLGSGWLSHRGPGASQVSTT